MAEYVTKAYKLVFPHKSDTPSVATYEASRMILSKIMMKRLLRVGAVWSMTKMLKVSEME